jgi:hypothetical protein
MEAIEDVTQVVQMIIDVHLMLNMNIYIKKH